MSLITDYLNELIKYQEKYGKHTIVLYQSGSFYNAYEYNPELCLTDMDRIDNTGHIWQHRVGNISEAAEICDCIITKPSGDNKPYGIKNVNFFGFPCTSIDNNVKKLLAADYVVVISDQVDGYTKKNTSDRIPHLVACICVVSEIRYK